MDEVNPVFRISQRAGFAIGVPEGSAARVELVEFDDPLPDRKRDLDDLLRRAVSPIFGKARVRAERHLTKCGRERPSPRQYSCGRTPASLWNMCHKARPS
jgi:hypothetical protein